MKITTYSCTRNTDEGHAFRGLVCYAMDHRGGDSGQFVEAKK